MLRPATHLLKVEVIPSALQIRLPHIITIQTPRPKIQRLENRPALLVHPVSIHHARIKPKVRTCILQYWLPEIWPGHHGRVRKWVVGR